VTPFPLKVAKKLRRLPVPLLGALLGVALGAAGMALLDPFGSPGPLSLPALTGHGSPGQPLNAQHVYNRLASSIIDITAVLRYDNQTAMGTGFVFDGPADLVLTNNHVVKDATSVTATQAATGKTYHVRVVGTDSPADIAVLQLDGPPGLTAAPIGDSGHIQLGDQVLVIGNQAGQGGPPTIAPGIINSLDRTIEAAGSGGFTETLHDMLQTSAQIEAGDSGGPLANAAGQVVGVDTAASTGAGTAGFAIPVNTALAVARQIAAGRPGPGISFGTVLCGTPAATSGLTAGDVIVRAAGRTVPSPGALGSIVAGCEPSTELLVSWVDLGGSTRDTLIRVASAPAP
jgi:S1-C subfamily serine protease